MVVFLRCLLCAGQNVSMELIDWQIGQASMSHAPAAAPTAPPQLSPGQSPGQIPGQNPGQAPISGPGQGPGQGPMPGPGQIPPLLPSGQAIFIDLTTPFFLGGVTTSTPVPQAMANYTVVDVPVRTISATDNKLSATLQLAIAHRQAFALAIGSCWQLFQTNRILCWNLHLYFERPMAASY